MCPLPASFSPVRDVASAQHPPGPFGCHILTSSPPPIVSHRGDTVIVHATNGLGDPTLGTALHTHGLFFNGTNHYDGAVSTTQCPIPPGQTLDYHIDTSNQQGTYWIHGHHEGQYTDGLRAPFIILPPLVNGTGRSDDVAWDDDLTLTVSDWYHDEYKDLIEDEFLTWTNPTGAEPVPSELSLLCLWMLYGAGKGRADEQNPP